MGRAYANKGEWEKAMEQFRMVIRLSPEEATVHYRMALVYRRLGNREEEKNEMALFRKLKAASDEKEKRATKVERPGMLDETDRSKKDKDIESEVE